MTINFETFADIMVTIQNVVECDGDKAIEIFVAIADILGLEPEPIEEDDSLIGALFEMALNEENMVLIL